MAQDFETLKTVLWEQFNDAVEWQKSDAVYYGSEAEKNSAIVGNRQAIAQLAQAIVAVQTKLDEKEQGSKGLGLKG